MKPRRVVIMGAGGRDFHDFNRFYRGSEAHRVIAFTATQIPHIERRVYPPSLAGPLYPDGIPIVPESELPNLIRKGVDEVVFAYSDVSHEYVMHKASQALALGCDFTLLGPNSTYVESKVPVIAVAAVRTGSGKSQTSRRVAEILRGMGKRVVAVRHPMPYGDLAKQRVQRFETVPDLDHHECTIEEREEYEPHLKNGTIVYAGIDYAAILESAEKEADVILWDGGNNDFPFFRPDLEIVVVDPHRPGHELRYHPGETNLRMADVVVINKESTARPEDVEAVVRNVREAAPGALIVHADSPFTVDRPGLVRGRRALVVEDGPTLTHGEMRYGAGVLLAEELGATLVDPRPWTTGEIRETFEKYPSIGTLLPAMGYGKRQIADLESTINAADCDVVVVATPVNLTRILRIDKPSVFVNYELREKSKPDLTDRIRELLARSDGRGRGGK